jgi:hypothetical protein
MDCDDRCDDLVTLCVLFREAHMSGINSNRVRASSPFRHLPTIVVDIVPPWFQVSLGV